MALNFNPQEDLLPTFPTPIARVTVPDAETLNAGLRRIILERAAADPGVHKSNAGGWQSEADLETWPEPEPKQFIALVHELVGELVSATSQGQRTAKEITIRAWANVNRKGDYNKLHHHPNNTWSGVYYVAAGKEVEGRPDSGSIEFQDPRQANPNPLSLAHKPVAGLILAFPSWLFHWVNPYLGEGERISISFNAVVRSQ